MSLSAVTHFLRLEAASGVILVFVALLALVVANSPAAEAYTWVFDTHFTIGYGPLMLDKPLLLWVNDGLMAVFFLLVGLEIKREVLTGDLSTPRKAALPIVAAIGGMVVPALFYAATTWGDPVAVRGWAIPAATDIAFALGILSLLGPRVPVSLKVFLTALAIIDDLGAIVIIALFYTADLSTLALGMAAVCIGGLVALNRAGVRSITPYVLIGTVLWVCVLKSGVHATLAGVVLAFAIPMHGRTAQDPSPLTHLEHSLHPWVAYGILPLFAFANAGVSLAGITPAAFLEPVPLGIILGLFLGKQIGVLAAAAIAIATGLARLPEGAGWRDVYGVSLLTGVGFTMSLFIGSLAFETTPALGTDVRLGVLAGSLLSGVAGYLVLRGRRPAAPAPTAPADG